MSNLIPPSCRHFPKGMPNDHACDAQLVLIGEAPGRVEDQVGYGFAGQSGREMEIWWESLGIRRSDFYICNVYPYRPPANKIEAIPHEAIDFWTSRLHERLAALVSPVVLVPTGNTALRALFGERRNISDWRGSICAYTDQRGRRIKTIPTIHPAATFRQPILKKFCLSDWARIASDRHFPDLRIPERRMILEPTDQQFGQFMMGLERAYSEVVDGVAVPTALAVDIETDRRTKELLCVGFSFDPGFGMVLPTSKRAVSEPVRERMLHYCRILCAHHSPKVLQNGQFDWYHLERNNIPLFHYEWDLMEMDHAVDPNDGGDVGAGADGMPDEGIKISMKSLAVLASLYTRQPFWKDQGKQSDGVFDWGKLYPYNNIDACVTQEIYGKLYVKLAKEGKL